MGLDITAYSKVEFVSPPALDEDGNTDWEAPEPEDSDLVYINPDFPGCADDLQAGWYRFHGTRFSFRAGSYSGYNRWRGHLAWTMTGLRDHDIWDDPKAGAGQPFLELINFSDCEGSIGAVVAAKLYQDFVDNEARYQEALKQEPDREWFSECYQNWMRAFELAKDGGYVGFH